MRMLTFSVLLTCTVLWTACQRDRYRAPEPTPSSQTPISQNRESEAINLVKKAILTVPEEQGPSAMTIEEILEFFMTSPGIGLSRGKGWSAKAESGNRYMVMYNFIDATAGDSQAIWSVDLGTRKVQPVNKSAKLFSWIEPK